MNGELSISFASSWTSSGPMPERLQDPAFGFVWTWHQDLPVGCSVGRRGYRGLDPAHGVQGPGGHNRSAPMVRVLDQ